LYIVVHGSDPSLLSSEEVHLTICARFRARREAGYQLNQIQHGREPDDWKPMNTVGRGVQEIRIRDAAGAFRVLYVAKFDEAVYVLHCFQKKTQKTSKADLNLAAQRYRDLLKELDQ
jgi:phage-related protein